jgi:hypothetical protein
VAVGIGVAVVGGAFAAFVLAAVLVLVVLVGGSVTQPNWAAIMTSVRIAVIGLNKVFTCFKSTRYDDDGNARAAHPGFVQIDAKDVLSTRSGRSVSNTDDVFQALPTHRKNEGPYAA